MPGVLVVVLVVVLVAVVVVVEDSWDGSREEGASHSHWLSLVRLPRTASTIGLGLGFRVGPTPNRGE